ncbi:MAG: hypothetical protein LBN10_06685 [Propionibacteriaceae bacterium]|jgi:hypothetical protein|nr:hypothetical protein [Propionibacteriaceae bacterium]
MKRLWDRWATDQSFRIHSLGTVSIILDLFLGIGMLVGGLWSMTSWYMASGVYYLAIGLVRRYVLRHLEAVAEEPIEHARVVYRRSGYLLTMIGTVFLAVCVVTTLVGRGPAPAGPLSYVVPIVTFIKLGVAIRGFVTARRSGDLLHVALRTTNLADALVSLGVIQYALMGRIGAADPIGTSARIGMGFAVIIVAAGLRIALSRHLTTARGDGDSDESNDHIVTHDLNE